VYDILSSALGGGSTSRLFERIREKEGLAYSIYSFHSGYFNTGMLGVYAAVAPENWEQVIELTGQEIRRLRDEPMTAEELESNREHLKGSMLMSLESPFNRMARMARSMVYYKRLVGIAEVIAALDAVTVDDVQAVARVTFQGGKWAMAVLGPVGGSSIRAIEL
jgi:predicted Zn-dependent peptidase